MYGTIIHYRFYQRFYRLICFRHPEGCSGRRAIDCFKIWIRLSAVEGEIIETHDRWIAGGKQQIWIWGVLINKTVLVWDFRYDDFQLLSYLSRSIRQVRASRWDQMSHQPCKSPKKIVVSPGHHRPRSQRQKIPQMQLKWPGPGMRRSQIFFFLGGVGESICKSGFFGIFYWEYHTISFWGVLWNKDKQRIYWNRERCGGIPINIINVWIPISINAVSPSQEGSRPVLLPTALKNNFADGAAWWGSLKGSPNGGFLSHRPPVIQLLGGIFHEINHPATSARVKSYQLLKVVSGGRAPGKSSSLASPQLLVIERFHCFGAVRLEKVYFFCISVDI